MSLYEKWVQLAYNKDGSANEEHWNLYMPKEQKVYEDIIKNKRTRITGTIKQLGERYNMSPEYVCGFVDGINEVLPQPYRIDQLEESTEVDLSIDFEKLYKKMVEYKAEHLYTLKEWNNIFTPEQLRIFYTQQKKSTTFVRTEQKVGRNDPCPCGSGLKYKKCCGAN